jgi:hypothetical protein
MKEVVTTNGAAYSVDEQVHHRLRPTKEVVTTGGAAWRRAVFLAQRSSGLPDAEPGFQRTGEDPCMRHMCCATPDCETGQENAWAVWSHTVRN